MEQIKAYFPDLTEAQIQQLSALGALYADWNAKINVISRKDMDDFYEHHVLHSLSIAKFVQFVPGTRILDLGTGGGFPGIPLAIMFQQVEFLLVDSTAKKLSVVDAVADTIGLDNVHTVHERAENLPGTFDFVTSRAVTRLNEAWGWVSPKISPDSKNSLKNGLLYLKGGDISAELPKGVHVQRFELKDVFTETYFDEKSLIYLSR